MKTYLCILLCLIIGLSNCCIKSDSINQQTRDTVIFYDNHHYLSQDGGCMVNFVPATQLDYHLYLEIRTYDSYLYDTKYDTTMIVPINYDTTYSFIEFFINKYYNHYPLLDNDYRVIKKMISYIYFFTDWWQNYHYLDKLEYSKMKHIIDLYFEDDTLERKYSFTLRDTIYDVQSNIELRYINDNYHFYMDTIPRYEITEKMRKQFMHN